MASLVEIANRGLQKIGAGAITSFTEQSPNARAVARCFYELLYAELSDNPWNFSIQRFQLAASATAPAFGPVNAFPLPTGWLRVLPPDPQDNFNDRDWIIEGDSIITNFGSNGSGSAVLDVRVVLKVEDANLMSPLFREALASRIGKELAEPLTQSNTKKEACESDYKTAIARARKQNAIQNVPVQAVEDTWLTARN